MTFLMNFPEHLDLALHCSVYRGCWAWVLEAIFPFAGARSWIIYPEEHPRGEAVTWSREGGFEGRHTPWQRREGEDTILRKEKCRV